MQKSGEDKMSRARSVKTVGGQSSYNASLLLFILGWLFLAFVALPVPPGII